LVLEEPKREMERESLSLAVEDKSTQLMISLNQILDSPNMFTSKYLEKTNTLSLKELRTHSPALF